MDVDSIASSPYSPLAVSDASAKHGTHLLDLANELLAMIASSLYFTPASLTQFMLVCRRTTDIGERIRYSSLMISGNRGRRTLAALLSDSSTSLRCCKLVHRLWFRGWADSDMHLNSALLAEVLPRLLGLTALWLDANPLDTAHLMGRIRKHGLVRERIHPAFAVSDMGSGHPASPWNLPHLEYVRLTGDPVMAGVVFHRCLVSLDLAHIMDNDELAKFLSEADNSLLGEYLETLSVKFARNVNLPLALPLIGGALSNLQFLSVEQHYLPVLEVVETIALPPSLFPKLRVLVLNRLYSYRIPRWGTIFTFESFSQDQMKILLSKVAEKHKFLTRIGVGRDIYEVGFYGVFGRKVLQYPDLDSWSSVFGEQLELSRFAGSSLNAIPQPVGLDWIAV